MAKKILILHEAGAAAAELDELAVDLRALGAEVVQCPCAAPYDAVLDAVADADSVVFWR
jgi:uroporphyrinogen-III synthase